jgi:signal transduction histidine kinase/ActR/RegA family two-component response regulator
MKVSKLSVKSILFGFMIFLVLITCITIIGEYYTQRALKDLIKTNNVRYKAYLLADQLRQSSDDLTRLARTYVVTGNPLYRKQYEEILEIRNGKKPRPQNPERIYWDFLATGNVLKIKKDKPTSLLKLMEDEGFSDVELSKLAEATKNSDDLVKAETVAMNIVKSHTNKNQNINVNKYSLAKARLLTHDNNYHEAKIKIFKPINEFFTMLDHRTKTAVLSAEQAVNLTSYTVFSLQIFMLLISAILSIIFYRFLLRQLGGEPSEIASKVSQISNGDLSVTYDIKSGDKTSILAVMKEMSTNLNKVVHELTLAQKNANQANNAKTMFLATMSHEIRTPMNGILGMIQLLNESNLNQKQKEMLANAKVSGDGLLSIINDILDFLKIESGHIDLEITNFNLIKCIQDAISLVEQEAYKKCLKIHLNYSLEEDLFLKGDVTRLRQIVTNFLSNAVKFTVEGEINIYVEHIDRSEDYVDLTIKVVDTGIGISEDKICRLFKEFSQADSSTTRKYGGTGLGLSISKRLAEVMNGEVFCKSILGVGSTFGINISLEIGKFIKSPEKNVIKDTSINEINLASSIPHKILLVEDNQINQKLASMMLSKLGYTCDIAANGYEALIAIENNHGNISSRYTLIFMDMMMPEMDGLTATKKIVNLYGINRPPIIALTANAFKEDKKKCLDSGMDDYISKPFSIKDLTNMLKKYGNESTDKSQ